FRQQRGSTESGDIISIQEWTQRLHQDIDRATKKVHTTIDTPAIDPHLLHMWDARRGLTNYDCASPSSAKRRKTTQPPWRKAIGTNYATGCSLLDPSRSKTETSKAVTKLLHGLQRDEPFIVKELESRYLAAGQRPDYAEYPYTEEPSQLDADFTESEIQAVLTKLTRTTTPGKDGVTYKILHNLDDASITALTRYFNEV
ncbi:hypothetical protein HPB47_015230, partial [Ixodes persulcatus]